MELVPNFLAVILCFRDVHSLSYYPRLYIVRLFRHTENEKTSIMETPIPGGKIGIFGRDYFQREWNIDETFRRQILALNRASESFVNYGAI
jgi:hypothetical protein